jgi:hypothetical protein
MKKIEVKKKNEENIEIQFKEINPSTLSMREIHALSRQIRRELLKNLTKRRK